MKTIYEHEISSCKASDYSSKASKTIERIDELIHGAKSVSSRFRNAVKAIDDACNEKAAEKNLKLTSNGIDKVRNQIKKEELRRIDLKLIL